jgi:dienelactone hydrolase
VRSALAVLALAAGAAGCAGGAGNGAGGGSAPVPSPARVAVGTLTTTIEESGAATPANGAVPGHAGRTLQTTVMYPATGPVTSAPVRGARPDERHGPYPLIVFAHGFGTSPDLSPYTTLMARWAGAGYVVAAPLFPLTRSDAPGGPDLSDFPAQPADMVAVVNRMLADSRSTAPPLAGMVDAHHIGAAGHSLGGVTVLGLVANTCCRDARIGAAVVMSGDPIVFPTGHPDYKSAPPLLLVHGNADPSVPYVSSIDAFNAAHGPKGLLTVLGGNHDAPVDPSGPAFASVVRTTTDFFDAYLKHSAGALARLGGDAQRGVTTLTFTSRRGSTVTLARPATPVLHLHATVSPATALADGQTVTVSWEGFASGVSVNVLECSHNPPTAAGDCDLKTGALLHPDPSGSGSLGLTVHTGVVGSGGGMCGASHPGCVIAVNQGGSLDPSSTVTVGISFATG